MMVFVAIRRKCRRQYIVYGLRSHQGYFRRRAWRQPSFVLEGSMIERIPCKICNREIVKFRDEAHDGICRICRPLRNADRLSKSKFMKSLNSGKIFVLSDVELEQSRKPTEWQDPQAWSIENSSFSKRYRSISRLLDLGENQSNGYVLCKSNREASFRIAFEAELAVCLFRNQPTSDFYAYTNSNRTTQVPRENHLCETCPCCGIVQGVYFASRFHMDRSLAFMIARSMLLGNECTVEVKWIPGDDCRWVEPGLG
jgi:hypothetical protein